MSHNMLSFNATFGVFPGYVSLHTTEVDAREIVAEAWNDAMQEEFDKSGVLISACLSVSRVMYPRKFGCPDGGELCVVATGVTNPEFVDVGLCPRGLMPDAYSWRNAVVRVVNNVKEKLSQEKVTLYFQKVAEFHYLQEKTSVTTNIAL